MDLNAKIDFSKIDLSKLKTLVKRKEFWIGVGVVVFIIGIVIAGKILIANYTEAKTERDKSKAIYEKIMSGETSIEKLKDSIDEVDIKIAENEGKISEYTGIEVREEAVKLLAKMRNDTGVYWRDEDRSYSAVSEVKGLDGISVLTINIKTFSASYNQIKSFMDYINNSEKMMTINSLNFSKDKSTGKMKGSMTLKLYYKNIEEAA